MQAATEIEGAKKHGKQATNQDWGAFEAVRPVLGPIVDLLKPIMTGNVMYGLLVGLLVAAWFGFGFPPNNGRAAQQNMGMGPTNGPHSGAVYGFADRFAAYEEMWRREETELWDWLEERVGLERLHSGRAPSRKQPIEPRTVEEKLREERMDEREIEEAIRITEEKLNVLKGVMGQKKQRDGGEGDSEEPVVSKGAGAASEEL